MDETSEKANPEEMRVIFNSAQRKNYFFFGLGFIVAFCLAFIVARSVFSPPAGDQPPPPRVLADGETDDFLRAVDAKDFEAMQRLGDDLFREKTRIPNSRRLFADYETTSYEPHLVYAFYSGTRGGKTQRVLLTMDMDDQVVSFLAEEMEIAP